MKKYLVVIIAIIVVNGTQTSCKKKNNPSQASPPDTPAVSYPDYFALKQGNYWVYQQYEVTDTSDKALNVYDSCYVKADTNINGKTYHIWYAPPLAGNTYNIQYVRDSLGYVVNNEGKIIFSSTDTTDIFYTIVSLPNLAHSDTETITEQMGFMDSIINVPAGSFITATFRNVYHYTTPGPYGTPRDFDMVYAKNTGLVKATVDLYYTAPLNEWRLIRYHVQ